MKKITVQFEVEIEDDSDEEKVVQELDIFIVNELSYNGEKLKQTQGISVLKNFHIPETKKKQRLNYEKALKLYTIVANLPAATTLSNLDKRFNDLLEITNDLLKQAYNTFQND